ncbi:MAG: DnaJ domain-containing protein [Cyanobacteria bacterium P01_E01_bin.6]
MADLNHYDVLRISPTATQAEIKRAYRQLAKQFHPDSNRNMASHEQIATINAAYEVLGDPKQRKYYDTYLSHPYPNYTRNTYTHPSRAASYNNATQTSTRSRRSSGSAADEAVSHWLKFVYLPVCRTLNQVLNAFDEEIDALSADPFDDTLMDNFQGYLDESRDALIDAQNLFRARPNPSSLAKVASHLYYCIGQLSDGIDELERFTTSYDDYYIHTGQELFRISRGLEQEAQAYVSHFL